MYTFVANRKGLCYNMTEKNQPHCAAKHRGYTTMNNLWKRAASLILSGILLMCCVPVRAWAEEEEEDTCLISLGGGSWDFIDNSDAETVIIDLAYGTTSIIAERIIAAGDIQITGEGTLYVGQIIAGGDLEIEDSYVRVMGIGDEPQTLVTVDEAICVWGTAHLVTASDVQAVGFLGENGGQLMGDGYYRTDEAFLEMGEFGVEVSGALGKLEMIAAGHLKDQAVFADEDHHHIVCDCASEVVVKTEAHSRDREAVCGQKAYCDVCKREYGEAGEHTDGTEFAPVNQEYHKEVYKCCGADYEDAAETPHSFTYEASGNVITGVCEVCQAEGSVTITMEDCKETETDLAKFQANVAGRGILEGIPAEPQYTNAQGELLDAAPQTYGKYTAFLTIGDTSASVTYYITKDLTGDDVMLDGDRLVYHGQPQTQRVFPKNADSDVTFTVSGNEQTDAGAYTLTVTGTECYSGSVEMAFTIHAAVPTASVKEVQSIVAGICDFEEPVFFGVDHQALAGEIRYAYQGVENLTYAAVKSAMAGEPAGEKYVSWTFQPEDPNYAAVSSENPMELTAKEVSFRGKNGVLTIDDLIEKDRLWYYGDTPVSTNHLLAFVDGVQTAPEAAYTVICQKDGAVVETRPLPAGTYTFEIRYTGKIGDVTCEAYPVFNREGQTFTIHKKQLAITKEHTVPYLTYQENTKQELLSGTPEANVEAAEDLVWEYRVNGVDSRVNQVFAVPQRTNMGVYNAAYRVSSTNANYLPSAWEEVKVPILPALEAVYGDTLASIALPESGEWTWEAVHADKLLMTPAGVVESHQLSYQSKADANLTWTGPVKITVSPKEIAAPVVVVEEPWAPYSENPQIAVKVKEAEDSTDCIDPSEYEVVPGAAPGTKTGAFPVTIRDREGGNYTLGSVTATIGQYRPSYEALTGTWRAPASMEGSEFDTAEKIREALTSQLEGKEFPAANMRYFEVFATKWAEDASGNRGWRATWEEVYYPDSGMDILIDYDEIGADLHMDDSFRVVILDAGTGNRLETAAEKSATVADYVKNEDGLQIHVHGHAIVGIVAGVDLTTEYEITKSIVLDGKTSTRGTLTIQANSKTVTKATYGTAIHITAQAKSGYAVEAVTVMDENGQAIALDKEAEGSYVFEMPASGVAVKLSLKKTTSSAKNAKTGDFSNIVYWAVLLTASGLGTAVLWVSRLRKRSR